MYTSCPAHDAVASTPCMDQQHHSCHQPLNPAPPPPVSPATGLCSWAMESDPPISYSLSDKNKNTPYLNYDVNVIIIYYEIVQRKKAQTHTYTHTIKSKHKK